MTERGDYQARKAFFDGLLTVYGRKAVLEALQDKSLNCHALHLADSNRPGGIVGEIRQLAQARDIPVRHHSRAELSRISKNGKQDQGVAADILCPGFRTLDDFLRGVGEGPSLRLLALDGITNPQNLGMIIRSAAAGAIDGILWSRRGNAALGPLVIKASVGTLYRAPIVQCGELAESLARCRESGLEICILDAGARDSLFADTGPGHRIFVLGNESEGVSAKVRALADRALSIPMGNGVESLNVAVTASLIAYAGYLER